MARARYVSSFALIFLAGLAPRLGFAIEGHTDKRDAGVGMDTAGPSPQPVATSALPQQTLVVSANARTAARVLSDPRTPAGMEKLGTEARVELLFSGRVLPILGWHFAILGDYGRGLATNESRLVLLDAIGKLELLSALNVWIGRMPIVSDRASLGFHANNLAWTPLGSFSPIATPIGIRRGDDSRGTGAVAFGQFGRLAYYAGLYDPKNLGTAPLISSRIALGFGAQENGFYRPSSYQGGKNTFALALYGQFQKDGSLGALAPDNYTTIGGDLFLEQASNAAGVLDWEASLAKFWGHNEGIDTYASSQLAYLMPLELGSGRFQTVLRGQFGNGKGDDSFMLIDGQLGYVLAGPRARVLGLYQFGKLPAGSLNLVLFGLQLATN